jgi:hypothetical protein
MKRNPDLNVVSWFVQQAAERADRIRPSGADVSRHSPHFISGTVDTFYSRWHGAKLRDGFPMLRRRQQVSSDAIVYVLHSTFYKFCFESEQNEKAGIAPGLYTIRFRNVSSARGEQREMTWNAVDNLFARNSFSQNDLAHKLRVIK